MRIGLLKTLVGALLVGAFFAHGTTLLAAPATQPAEAIPTVDSANSRVIGLRVADPTVNQQAFDRAPLPAARGTVVRVMIEGLDNPMVGVNRKVSTVRRFVDSTGRALRPDSNKNDGNGLADPKDATGRLRLSTGPVIGPDAVISRDKAQLAVAFRAPRLPAENASAIALAGEVRVRVGVGERRRTIDSVSLDEGQVLLPGDTQPASQPRAQRAADPGKGPGRVSIVRVGKANWGKQPMHVHLQLTGRRADHFVKARFFDANGNDVTARQMPPVRMAETMEVPIALKRRVRQATVKLTFYQRIEARRVPVQLKAGLGLGKGAEPAAP